MYFLQGIGEPTDGLSTQPVIALLKFWEIGPQRISTFTALLGIPWALKPLYGMLTDFVPLAGYRRKSYLVTSNLLAMVGFFSLYAFPPSRGDDMWLLLALLLPTIGVAFADVVIDALMVEHGQPLGLTGRFQSIQWAALWGANICIGVVGGHLSAQALHHIAFLICGIAASVMLVLSVTLVKEPAHQGVRGSLRRAARELWKTARTRSVFGAGLFLFLWSFNPFSAAVLNLYVTKTMQLGEEFYGYTQSIYAIAAMLACVAYGYYCRRFSMRALVHASIVLGIITTLAYWALTDRASACAVFAVAGFAYMTAMLVQLDLAAQSCPIGSAGTTFALVMALSNLGTSTSSWVGGYLYEDGIARWGEFTAFHVLVGIGALFTAGCWLVVPLLRPVLNQDP
jgi:MFS family permease